MALNKTVTVTKDNNFLIYLGIFFIIFKLTGIVEWSWWLVLLPFWIIPAIGIFVFIVVFFFFVFVD